MEISANISASLEIYSVYANFSDELFRRTFDANAFQYLFCFVSRII